MNPAKALMERLNAGLKEMSTNCQLNQATIKEEFERMDTRITVIEERLSLR